MARGRLGWGLVVLEEGSGLGGGGGGRGGLVVQPSKMFIESAGGLVGRRPSRMSRGCISKSWKELSEEKIEIFSNSF